MNFKQFHTRNYHFDEDIEDSNDGSSPSSDKDGESNSQVVSDNQNEGNITSNMT
jgi:hypothetical protein